MMKPMWSVSSLVSYIKQGIDHDENLMQLFVQGEISNLVKHRSGHYYFTLKDDKARMNCVMFANFARLIRFNLENGSKVIANCKVSVYEASGSVQLYVNALQLDGIGDLYYQFEQLKKKLHQEGYFDPTHKKELPEYPMDIAVISAKEAAALHDVKITLKRRWPLAKITLYPSLVQGSEASKQLIETIQKADLNQHEVILLVRGGGSIEDLWAFNDENLTKCIYYANTPIVSGVGHESDTTLVDYVTDARAATPTAAAELITPDIHEVSNLLQRQKKQFMHKMMNHYNKNEIQLKRIQSHPFIKNPYSYIENNMISIDLKKSNFENIYANILMNQSEIQNKKDAFQFYLKMMIRENKTHINEYQKNLLNVGDNIYKDSVYEYKKRIELLDAFSPLKVLLRGYSLTKLNDTYLRSVEEVHVNDEIQTVLNDGIIVSKVLERRNKND